VTLHLYATSSGFRQFTEQIHPDTLGVANPSRNEIAIDCSKTTSYGANNFLMTLRHEMIHIAFGRLTERTRRKVPLWFNEGVACWATDCLRTGLPQNLVRASTVDALIPLDRLRHSFPSNRIGRELAYQ
jgi:hypothetical protein